MHKRHKKTPRTRGVVLMIVSFIAFVIYTYLLLETELGILILKLTVLATVAILLLVLGWIGYTMSTAPQSE